MRSEWITGIKAKNRLLISVLKCVILDVFSLIRQIAYIKYTFVKEYKKVNILFYLLPNNLLLNLIDLYIYDYQILDSFSINEFAGIRCVV